MRTFCRIGLVVSVLILALLLPSVGQARPAAGRIIYLPFFYNGALPAEMISIAGGSFAMGCDSTHNGGHLCASDELPLHPVMLSAYQIDKTEVTNGQYAQCVKYGGCTPLAAVSSATREDYATNPNYARYPVINVTWTQATAYCAWANLRLPTEAEWEKAAHGMLSFAYPWGDGEPACTLANYYNLRTLRACVGDTVMVGSYPGGASPSGVLDMAGNVGEWVADWYASDAYSAYVTAGSPPDPTGPDSGTYRVTRGGTWGTPSLYLRTASRVGRLPGYHDPYLGFRCARTLK